MTDELSYEASELFRSARTGLSPSDEDLARGRRRLAAAIAAGGVSVGAVATAKAGGLANTLVLAAFVAGGAAVGGATWWARARRVEATAPAINLPAPETPESPHIVAAEVMPSPTVAAPAAPARSSAPTLGGASRVVVPAVKNEAAAPVEDSPAAPAGDGLARELELVRSADSALRSGDAARALTIARADNVVQLAAELSAIEIDALCSLQRRDEAHDRVLAFRRRFPYSALADRVERSCEGGKR